MDMHNVARSTDNVLEVSTGVNVIQEVSMDANSVARSVPGELLYVMDDVQELLYVMDDVQEVSMNVPALFCVARVSIPPRSPLPHRPWSPQQRPGRRTCPTKIKELSYQS